MDKLVLSSKAKGKLGYIMFCGISKFIAKMEENDINIARGMVQYYKENYVLSADSLTEELDNRMRLER